MARKVETPLTLTLAASGLNSTIYASDITTTFQIRDFNRDEWSNTKLQNSQDLTTGARPQIVTNSVNAPIQIAIENCGFSNSISTGPDDANLSNILQRMNITQYDIVGAASSPTAVSALQAVYNDHKKRMDGFEFYLARLSQNISYQLLIDFRNYTFSYLTSTGLTMNDPFDLGSISNVLITDFSQGLIHLDYSSQSAITKGWRLVIQSITITSRAGY